jgi:hypothetical protein
MRFKFYIGLFFIVILTSCTCNSTVKSVSNLTDSLSIEFDTTIFHYSDTALFKYPNNLPCSFINIRIKNHLNNTIYFEKIFSNYDIIRSCPQQYFDKKDKVWNDPYDCSWGKDSLYTKLTANKTDKFVILNPFDFSDTVELNLNYALDSTNGRLFHWTKILYKKNNEIKIKE